MATQATTVRRPQTRKIAKRVPRLLVHLALIVVGFIYMFPFLWIIAGSFKTPGEFFKSGLSLIPKQLLWDNYVYAWNTGNFSVYFVNTVVTTISVTVLVILLSSMAGYVLSKTFFPGRKLIMVSFLVLMFLPAGYTIIPIFELVQNMGLLNSLFSIIIVQAAGGLIFNTLLFMGYFATIDKEIEEAAIVDGANLPITYWRIMLPMAKPMIATVALFQFMANWNSFWIPLVFTLGNPNLRTLAVGMYSFAGENSTGWTYIAAGAVISILPIMAVFFFLQRYFIEAVAGAIKG
ncbi:MAG: carbohydrate ABC transporter permease [Chloroflexi bacterium]|nr:carbohydrate ABC transporter permease [Chloroflexota bacterium]